MVDNIGWNGSFCLVVCQSCVDQIVDDWFMVWWWENIVDDFIVNGIDQVGFFGCGCDDGCIGDFEVGEVQF